MENSINFKEVINSKFLSEVFPQRYELLDNSLHIKELGLVMEKKGDDVIVKVVNGIELPMKEKLVKSLTEYIGDDFNTAKEISDLSPDDIDTRGRLIEERNFLPLLNALKNENFLGYNKDYDLYQNDSFQEDVFLKNINAVQSNNINGLILSDVLAKKFNFVYDIDPNYAMDDKGNTVTGIVLKNYDITFQYGKVGVFNAKTNDNSPYGSGIAVPETIVKEINRLIRLDLDRFMFLAIEKQEKKDKLAAICIDNTINDLANKINFVRDYHGGRVVKKEKDLIKDRNMDMRSDDSIYSDTDFKKLRNPK